MAAKVGHSTLTKRKALRAGFWPPTRLAFTLLVLVLIATNLVSATTCSIQLNAVTIACPLGVLQVMAAARKLIPALLVAAILGIGLVVVFGRAYCSWVCPGRWFFNRRNQSKPLSPRVKEWTQRILVGGVVGAAWVCHNPVFCSICPAGVFCRGAIAAGAGGSAWPALGWTGLFVGVEWLSGRSWCRDLCPLGAALTQFSRFNPFLKFKSRPAACVPCNICEQTCPEGLNLSKEINLPSCTKCFACQPVCPRNAIEVKLIDFS